MTNNRSSRAILADAPAFPERIPDGRWSDQDLQAYLQAQDAQITALEPLGALLPLEAMRDEELEALAGARSQEEAQTLEKQFAAGQQSRPKQKVIKVTK
jgi:hypothetical protein